MYQQITTTIESQFLYYYIALILGIQISIYSYYHYYKNRDANLRLNRILLSIGTYILLSIFGAFLLLIARLFELNYGLETFLTKIGFISVMCAPIGFIGFILRDEFTRILNLKISRILMILNFIPLITAIIFPISSLINQISIIFMVANSLNIIQIQIRLIKTSIGKIKKRFSQFFIGEILAIIALAFAAQVSFSFFPFPVELSFFIGTSLLILGFIIIFLSIYKFPPFYEFEWKENLLKFFVINSENNSIIYHYDFTDIDQPYLIDDDEKYFSGGLKGIDSIVSTITYSKTERLNAIKHGELLILLEYNLDFPIPIIYALIVKRDLSTFRLIINTLKNQFETFFRDILINLDDLDLEKFQELLFSSFEIIIKNILYHKKVD